MLPPPHPRQEWEKEKAMVQREGEEDRRRMALAVSAIDGGFALAGQSVLAHFAHLSVVVVREYVQLRLGRRAAAAPLVRCRFANTLDSTHSSVTTPEGASIDAAGETVLCR